MSSKGGRSLHVTAVALSHRLLGMAREEPPQKPLLRGYFHQEAFFISLGACSLLVAKSSSRRALVASLIYSLGLLMLFGVSAWYHRKHWEPKARALMKRLDHSAIFIFIACTATPIGLLILPEASGRHLLWVMWTVALAGVVQSILWVRAPEWISALLYVGMGWIVYPYFDALYQGLGRLRLALIVAGGIVYTIGAICYALKRPRLVAGVFGYHELFHVLTILGALLHFIVIYQLVA